MTRYSLLIIHYYNMIKKLMSGFGAMFMAGAALLGNANSVAAAGCQGNGCMGRDPQAMGCWRDAKTVAVSPIPGTAAAGWNEVVELRYSKICAAQWSRVSSRLGTAGVLYTTAYMFDNPTSTRVTRYGVAAKAVWSKMWPAVHDIGQACGNTVLRADPTYKPTHCAAP